MLTMRRYLAVVCDVFLVISLCGCYIIQTTEPREIFLDAQGGEYTTKNNITIYYSGNISSEEISALSQVLAGPQKIKLERIDGTFFVYFIVPDDYLKKVDDGNEDIEFDESYENEAMAISTIAFDKSPVVVNICDSTFKVYKSYTYDPKIVSTAINENVKKLNYSYIQDEGCIIWRFAILCG